MKIYSLQHSLFKNQSHCKESRLVFDEWASEDFDDVHKAPASTPALAKKADEWGDEEESAPNSPEALRDKIEEKVDDLEVKMNEIIDDFDNKYSPAYKERVSELKKELLKIKDQVFHLNIRDPKAPETLAKIDLQRFESEIASPLLREEDSVGLEREVFALGAEIKEDYFNRANEIIDDFIERNFGYVDGLHDKTQKGLRWIARQMRETRPGRAELISTVEEAQEKKDPKKFKEALNMLKKANMGQVLTSFENFLNNSSLDAWNHYVVFIRKSLAAMNSVAAADVDEIGKMHTQIHEEFAAKALRGESLTLADVERYEQKLDAILKK